MLGAVEILSLVLVPGNAQGKPKEEKLAKERRKYHDNLHQCKIQVHPGKESSANILLALIRRQCVCSSQPA